MKICFIVDANSPIAQNWIAYFLNKSTYDIHIITTRHGFSKSFPSEKLHLVPSVLRLGTSATRTIAAENISSLKANMLSSSLKNVILNIYDSIMSLDTFRLSFLVKQRIRSIKPDIVHAMRIPFEGIIAARAFDPEIPLIVSVWGNDFTLHSKNPLVAFHTRATTQHANALHTDCWRDLQLAHEWGFDQCKSALVVPSGGGIQTKVFYPGKAPEYLYDEMNIPKDARIVINPRGVRHYVKNDMFFQSIPLVLNHIPDTHFICINMLDNAAAQGWIDRLGIQDHVHLTGPVDRVKMADYYRISEIMISPTIHDGTPNSFLEAIACGCFPVASQITDSLGEWITDGENGFLFDVYDPHSIAHAMVTALKDPYLREKARKQNQQLIEARAAYPAVMKQVEDFYASMLMN